MKRLRAQDGFVIPTAIWMLMLGLLFCGLALGQAMIGLRKAHSSQASTRAQAAAQAGLRMAIFNINNLALNGSAATNVAALLGQPLGTVGAYSKCLTRTTAAVDGSAAGGTINISNTLALGGAWCPPVTMDLGGGATVEYQLSSILNCNAEVGISPPGALVVGTVQECFKRKIVATGRVDGIQRRAYTEANAIASVDGASVLGLPVVTGVHLQLAKQVGGAYRECTPGGATAANPIAGC